MAEITRYVPFSALFALPMWNLTRGVEDTFDLANELGKSGTWAITDAPDDFTIDAATGILTADPSHLADVTVLNGTVGTEAWTVNVEMRDWLPSDSGLPISHMVSMFRSRDGSSGVRLFTVDLINPLTANYPTALQTGIEVSTGADGRIDVTPLETAMASYNNCIAVITDFNDLGSVGTRDAVDVSNRWFAFAYKAGGGAITYFTTPTGIRVARADWSPNTFNNDGTWSTTNVEIAEYTNHGGLMFTEGWWASYALIKRRESGSTPSWSIGDDNLYPAVSATNNAGNQFTLTGSFNGLAGAITSAAGLDWLSVMGANVPRNESGTLPKLWLSIASLERDARSTSSTESVSNNHSMYGYDINARRYDFAEAIFFDPPNIESLADDFLTDTHQMEYNAAAVIGNQNLYA